MSLEKQMGSEASGWRPGGCWAAFPWAHPTQLKKKSGDPPPLWGIWKLGAADGVGRLAWMGGGSRSCRKGISQQCDLGPECSLWTPHRDSEGGVPEASLPLS